MTRITNFEKRIQGEWTTETCGGNSSHPFFYNNPCYRIQTTSGTKVTLTLEAPKTYSVNIRILKSSPSGNFERNHNNINSSKISSGDYRPGFCYLEFDVDKVGNGNFIFIYFLCFLILFEMKNHLRFRDHGFNF